jgi:hypothetical protein
MTADSAAKQAAVGAMRQCSTLVVIMTTSVAL